MPEILMTTRDMRRIFLFASLILLLYAAPSQADTTVGGRIAADTTWTLANSPYVVTSSVQVYGTTSTPVTLTIEPGVTVKFNNNMSLQIGSGANKGALISQGTSTNRITFTRSGTSGAWTGLNFQDGTVDGTTIIEYADIQYSAGVTITSASPTIRNSTITNVTGYGLTLNSSNPVIDTVTISNAGIYGIYLSSSSPIITSGSLSNSSTTGHGIYGTGSPSISNYTVSIVNTANYYGIYLSSGSTSSLSITNSSIANGLYLGTANITPTITGNTITNSDNSPVHAGANIIGQIMNNNTVTGMSSAGKIEVVSEQVRQDARWAKWNAPYVVVSGTVSIYKDTTSPSTLTIDPGVTVKFASGAGLQIANGASQGALVAQGTAGNRITFTRNGTSGTWVGLSFHDGTIDNSTIIEYADVQYSTGVYITQASPVIRNSTITDVTGNGLYLITSNPTLENVTISNNGSYGIYMPYSSSPVINGGSITNTNTTGYGIYGVGSPVISNLTVSIVNTPGNYGIRFTGTSSSLSITNSSITNGLYLSTTGIVPVITGNTFWNSDNFPIHAGANIIGQIMNNNTVNGMTAAGRIEIVGETINQDARWKQWPSPYLAYNGTIYVFKDVATAATLTIDPGVIIKFNANTGLQVGNGSPRGVLSAVGTAVTKILFTTSSPTPAPGSWTGITFSGAGAGASVLENAIIEYAGYGTNYFNANIALLSSGPAVRKTISQNSAGSGIFVQNATMTPLISSCTVTGNKWGVYSLNSNPIVSDTIITGNTTAGVTNANSATTVDARNSWWGSATGPTHPGNPGGTGNVVSDYVLYSPWLTQQPGTSSVTISDTQAMPSSLNPDGDFTTISATISEQSDWTITIADNSMNQVRHLSGTGFSVNSAWYGENDQGQKVADGDYYYWIDAYSTAWGVHASSPQGLLMVSRQLPIAIFTQPANNQMFAAGSTIAVTGTATDSTDFFRYTLAYGVGVNPTSWVTIKNTTNTVTNGLLHSWDTSGLAGGVYTLKLSVLDHSNNEAVETAALRLLAVQNQAVSEAFFSPNADEVKDTTTVSASVNYPSNWTISIKNGSGGTVRTYTGEGTAINQAWDGKDVSSQVVADGLYTFQVDAVSTETAVAALPKTGTVTVDSTPPSAQITAPAPNAPVRNVMSITGTASDTNFSDYRLEYGPAGGSGPWSTITATASGVTGGVLGTWATNDSTNTILLQNDAYALRLVATDKAGNSSSASVPVNGDNLILSGISASSNTLDTNTSQSVSIFFTINSAATVTVKAVPEKQGPTGSPVYQTSQNMTNGGAGSFSWDGRDGTGKVVPDEAYLFILEASDGTKTDSYNPPAPTGTGSVTCTADTYDPYKNDPLIINYTLSQPARVTLSMQRAGVQPFDIMSAVPQVSGSYSYEWDGRGPVGEIVSDALNNRCMIASLLGENAIVTSGDTPKVSAVKSDPYMITLSYGQFTKILYSLSRNATVTVTLDKYQGLSIMLISGESQAEGEHELSWNGLDPSDQTGKALTASSEGTYNVTVEAVNPSTGSKSRYRAYLHLSD